MLAGTYSPPRASALNGDAGAGDDGGGSLAGDADAGHTPPASDSESGSNIGGRKRHAAEAFGEESMLGRVVMPGMPAAMRAAALQVH